MRTIHLNVFSSKVGQNNLEKLEKILVHLTSYDADAGENKNKHHVDGKKLLPQSCFIRSLF